MSSIETFGVIGAGQFGRFAAEHLAPPDANVLMYDRKPPTELPPNVERADLRAIRSCDAIMLAIPFSSYDRLIPRLRYTNEDVLLIDVCSVKLLPTEMFEETAIKLNKEQDQKIMDRPDVLMTHPLFGPKSFTRDGGLEGQQLVVTNEKRGPRGREMLSYWRSLGVDVTDMSADEHDREMAVSHALPFFIGRVLLDMHLESRPVIKTPYFKLLLELVDTEAEHSLDLFQTIQRFNPYAAAIRSEFLALGYDWHAREGVSTDVYHHANDALAQSIQHQARKQIIDGAIVALASIRNKHEQTLRYYDRMAGKTRKTKTRLAEERKFIKSTAVRHGYDKDAALALLGVLNAAEDALLDDSESVDAEMLDESTSLKLVESLSS